MIKLTVTGLYAKTVNKAGGHEAAACCTWLMRSTNNKSCLAQHTSTVSALYTDTYTETHKQTCAHNTPTSVTVTHTQQFNVPLSGTTRVSRYQKKHSPTHTHEEEEERFAQITKSMAVEVHPLYGALSQRGLLDAIKPAYNQSRLDGRLKLTASTFN